MADAQYIFITFITYWMQYFLNSTFFG